MKLNWFNKLVFALNLIGAICLALANYSYAFEPNSNTAGYLWGMAYPLFLVTNFIFLLYWMYLRKFHFLLSAVIILLGYSNVKNLVAINFSNQSKEESSLSVMSFNVRLFNQYNWIENHETKNNIFKHIEEKKPDVLAIQEFFESTKNPKENIKRLKALGYRYYVREPNRKHSRKTDFFGLIIFSKFKIQDNGIAFKRENKDKSISYYADIKVNDKIIRVYNTHLNSLGFKSEDYEFVENIGNNSEQEAIRKSKNILSKIMIAARKRQVEVEAIKQHIDSCPHPVILLGDFNEPPYSYAYPQFTSKLKDPFQKFGFGLGTTFDGIATVPGLRLDYVLHSEELVSTGFNSGPKNLSDHRPLYATFTFSE